MPPEDDAAVAAWVREVLGDGSAGDGLVDLHTHFLPESVLRKVWGYFDQAHEHYGRAWPVHYRLPQDERVEVLRGFGVTTFAPLVYAHKPAMAQWLNDWVRAFAEQTPGALTTATFFAEPDAPQYVRKALDDGARVVKTHVQVGGFDPRDAVLDGVWGLLAEAGVPVVVHCGDGPIPGRHTGIAVFEEVLARHPRLTAVIAHAGLPQYGDALALLPRYPNVHLDTTMVGTAFTQEFAPLPPDWPARIADAADRIVLGTDFPNIPYAYAEQLAAIAGWASADERLGPGFLRAVLRDTALKLIA
jgi:hypothetical protein